MSSVFGQDELRDVKTILENHYEDLKRFMFGIALDHLHNRTDAEDAVSDAFVRIYSNLKKFKNRSYNEIKAYCRRTIESAARDVYRSNRRSADHLNTLINEKLYGMKEFEGFGLAELKDALSRIPKDWGEEMCLHYFNGIPVETIADEKGLSTITVYKHMEKAVSMIREYLGKGDEKR